MRTVSLLALAATLGIALCTGSCATAPRRTERVVVVDRHGPPAHAQAHGYRRHHTRPQMVYDQGLQVYVVAGVRDTWFMEGRYFRLAAGTWECSSDFEDGWRRTSLSGLPPGLQKKYDSARNESRGRGRGKGK